MAKGSFDFSEYEKFVKSLGDADKDFELFLTDFLVEMGQRVIARTRENTPVKTGALKASWMITDVGKDYITIGSPMEYSAAVEYGHVQEPGRFVPAIGKRLKASWVNGRFMLTIAVDDIQKQIPKRFEKAFQQFMKSRGVG